jgi:hypothetical protein
MTHPTEFPRFSVNIVFSSRNLNLQIKIKIAKIVNKISFSFFQSLLRLEKLYYGFFDGFRTFSYAFLTKSFKYESNNY